MRPGSCYFAVSWWCDPALVCLPLPHHPAARYRSQAPFQHPNLSEPAACSVTAAVPWGCRVVPGQDGQVTLVQCCGRDCYLCNSPLVSWSQISEVTDAAGFAPDLGRRSLGGGRWGLIQGVGDALLVVHKWMWVWVCCGWSFAAASPWSSCRCVFSF